ncbi:alpha/beta hydrolase fold protein [Hyphomonas johnsonii MHS-2]|uniref:Alpha/beta hydrolase fold protein n=2 Tax=Hyphomonas johnsonii TaxID=81031 RepID=A0A059FUD4_9PROT|nr:alpha/beta hydrolase fold protein [Hyphomonas johnsonii MHS-2]
MADTPESGWIVVDGARIEWAAWGERGKPGLLLLIGNGAHMGWWRPLASMLARDYRVATFNWSGMGTSDWRDAYPIPTFLDEALGVATDAGLFDAEQRPFLGAHSFGGFLGLQLLIDHGDRFAGGILIDSRMRLKAKWGNQATPAPRFRVHPKKDDTIARFRLIPQQPVENDFFIRMLAEGAVVETEDGWRFRQDFDFRRKTQLEPDMLPLIPHARCPLAFVRGELTQSVTDEIWQAKKAVAPAGTPFVEIPHAHHHVMVDQPIALVSVMRVLLNAFQVPRVQQAGPI